jgi:hypothetical protein
MSGLLRLVITLTELYVTERNLKEHLLKQNNMKKIVIFFFAFLMAFNAGAQKRNYIWCFGDSAGIDFNNLSNPTTFSSGNDTRGSNCAIADTNGNLLFYALTCYLPYYLSGNVRTGAIFNRYHELMANGDSSVGICLYNEVIIIPYPANDSMYYVFFAGVGPIYGLYYAIVNLNANNGLGAVVSKNNQLVPFAQIDCLNAIKHGNGRDWWLFFRRRYPSTISPNNEFYSFLISNSGITNYNFQNVGSFQSDGGGKLTFSKQGDKLIYSGWKGLIEKYDFNRCTGIISNPITIHFENNLNSDTLWASNELSSDGKVLYVSTSNDTSYLFQFDLTAPNIASSRQTIWSTNYPINAGGVLKRGPDGKIYFACIYNSVYPYPDSVSNMYNENLSVINLPDSIGAACDFQPYSFYLRGKRTYWGLPNNPDYDMPAWAGSPCDTILSTSVNPPKANLLPTLMLTYVTEWQKLFVNAQHLKGKNCVLEIFDVTGKLIYSSAGLRPSGLQVSDGGYFTQDINCTAFANGLYLVNLKTEKETLVKKVIVD